MKNPIKFKTEKNIPFFSEKIENFCSKIHSCKIGSSTTWGRVSKTIGPIFRPNSGFSRIVEKQSFFRTFVPLRGRPKSRISQGTQNEKSNFGPFDFEYTELCDFEFHKIFVPHSTQANFLKNLFITKLFLKNEQNKLKSTLIGRQFFENSDRDLRS